MADISTGRQRGIVPFVDETTGRLPDQYLPQGVIDLQGDLEQAVTNASQSATAAKASETAAKASETAAGSAAQAAAVSAESAQTATESAASSKDAAAQSASEASASAQTAETSKTSAAASASAAETSETNAAASASAAKASETNAAASATAAQQAVDGFGLEVGTTTTGEPGSDASVTIQKNGTKYTANFTIPRGDKGADGVNENVPLGTASGIVAQATDAYPTLPRKVQVHGISGVHTVEPTKIIVSGKNLIPIGKISSGSSAGINWKANDDKTFTVSGTSTNVVDIPFIPSGSTWNLLKGRYTVKAIGDLQNGIQIFIRDKKSANWFMALSNRDSVKSIDIDEDTVFAECSIRIPSGVTLENSVYGIQIELGNSDTSYETPNIKSVDFTQSISLSDGDTLTIDRDGTTRIVHSEGEPTVLDNVTLPELPAPTFNVYTTGGYVPPTVDVDYERDVNLVLQALEAKIAALQVADKTN